MVTLNDLKNYLINTNSKSRDIHKHSPNSANSPYI